MKDKKCLKCSKNISLTNAYFPFCSDRCKLVDLGNWASETYKISQEINNEEEYKEQIKK